MFSLLPKFCIVRFLADNFCHHIICVKRQMMRLSAGCLLCCGYFSAPLAYGYGANGLKKKNWKPPFAFVTRRENSLVDADIFGDTNCGFCFSRTIFFKYRQLGVRRRGVVENSIPLTFTKSLNFIATYFCKWNGDRTISVNYWKVDISIASKCRWNREIKILILYSL